MIKSLHVLHCGSQPTDKGAILTYRVDMGKIVEAPMRSFLIRTDEGNILFDAGISPEVIASFRAAGREFNVTEKDLLLQRLAEIGVAPEDIGTVILSHLHYDHCGFLKAFSHAEVIIQRAEYSFAFGALPYTEGVYVRSEFDLPGVKWRLIDGDEFLMPGVAAILTTGHTPGHQSLMLELPQTGSIILTGDSVFCRENVEEEIIPGIFYNPTDAFHSIKKLKLLAQIKNARFLYSHDIEWQTSGQPSEYY